MLFRNTNTGNKNVKKSKGLCLFVNFLFICEWKGGAWDQGETVGSQKGLAVSYFLCWGLWNMGVHRQSLNFALILFWILFIQNFVLYYVIHIIQRTIF